MKRALLFALIFSLLLTGCFNRQTPTLDMAQIKTIAAQTAVVQATQIMFQTQVARLTQGLPTSIPTQEPTNTPVVITAVSTQPAVVTPAPTQPVVPPPPGPTPLPTLPQPTPRPTLVPRPGGSYVASKLGKAPNLDGVWDEWTTTKFPITAVVWNRNGNSWSGSADLEGSFRIGYDANYLYIAVKVLDDTYSQNNTGENIYKGDSVEVLIDADLTGDYYSDQLTGDDYQLGLSPGKGGTSGTREAYLWFPRGSAGSRSSVNIGSVSTSDTWRLEAAIPWSVLGVTPSNGLKLGFALSISDCDDKDGASQDAMVSTAPGRYLSEPTTWGTLTLQ